jgi:intracellular septation protein A
MYFMSSKPKSAKKENLLLNILLNIVIPTLVLTKLSGEQYLGVKMAIVVALAFPIGYGLMDFHSRSKINLFSILGVVSVMLTGGISLLELDPKYIAIKEASIPGLLGIATLISIKTPWPLVKTLLYNPGVIRIDRIEIALKRNNTEAQFQSSLQIASILVAASFFVSSILNFILAKFVVVSTPGTEQFNIELGRLTALSYPVIVIPSMLVLIGSLVFLAKSIRKYTGLKFEEILVDLQEDDSESKNETGKMDV